MFGTQDTVANKTGEPMEFTFCCAEPDKLTSESSKYEDTEHSNVIMCKKASIERMVRKKPLEFI